MFLSRSETRAASTRVLSSTGLSTNERPIKLPIKKGMTDIRAAGFSNVQMRDGLKITLLKSLFDSAFFSTALFAKRYLSKKFTGDLNDHPASAALMKTNGIGLSELVDPAADRQSIAVNPK